MKKIYTSLFLVLLFIKSVIAQPVISAPNYPPFGTVITTHEVTATSVTPGSAGASQTWDFSAYPATGNTSNAQYVNPATTPFAAMFPTATTATLSPSTGGNDGYGYIYSTSSYSDLIGAGISSTTGPNIVYSYSNPQRIGNYPMYYNTSYTDNFIAFATYVNGGYTINQYRRGSIVYAYDGYGTLTNLNGTYSNVVRGKLEQVVSDSIVIVGFPATSSSLLHSTTYGWGLATGYTSLFYLSYDTSWAGAGPPTPSKTAAYTTAIPTGLEKINVTMKPLVAYPNPVANNDELNLRVDNLKPGDTKFVAIDIQGKTVKTFDFQMFAANHKDVTVDVRDLSPGVYSVRLEQSDGVYVTRFIRQ